MALNDLELSLMAFPQHWDGVAGTLSFNLLLLPVGDPTAPLGTGPRFAGTAIDLIINLASGLDSLPTTSTVPSLVQSFVATPQPVAPLLFKTLFDQLVAKGITVTSGKLTVAPPPKAQILKALPESYKLAFPFGKGPSDYIKDTDAFGCGLRAQAPGVNPTLPPPDSKISWGQVISYALRQPVLAQALGLIYSPITLNVSSALVTNGGFIWVTLDPSNVSNPWVNDFNPDTVKSYAARLPELGATEQRPLFAARLFPVVKTIDPNLATAQLEAEEYDDGFAQVVHSNQPTTIAAATLDPKQISPGAEAGIQLGWDDEQVTFWLNSQIDLLRKRVPPGSSNAAESPLGVMGYRVDIRQKGATIWNSLCVVNGTLPFDSTSVSGGATTSISGNEFWVAPAPVRPSSNDNASNDQPGWLPLYFSQWTGSSVVLPDSIVQLLAFAVANPGTPLPPASLPNPNPDLTKVPTLRYGDDYEFRVRLVDLTGGGPFWNDPSVHPGPAPTTQLGFRRYVPPKSLEVTADPPNPPFPAKPDAVRTINTFSVLRPFINYPEAVFAGVTPSTFARPNLDNLIQDAATNGRAIGVPDLDVDRIEVRVEARIPAHDTGTPGTAPGDLDDVFRVIYSVEIPFPAGDNSTLTLALNYIDGIDDISTLSPPAKGTTKLPIPTGRDIRVRLFPRAADKPDYYGTPTATIGLPSDYVVRKEATTEHKLFPNNPEPQLQAFYFQPGANIMQLLAQRLNLKQDGLQFFGAAGERTVFGASGNIRHSISADASSMTFSNQTELLGQWIIALMLDMERDWTWDGLSTPALSFGRDGTSIGVITVPRVVASNATSTPGVPPTRSRTRIVFFDAYNPQPVAPAFPAESNLDYNVTALFPTASKQQFAYSIRLPITTRPTQTPRIVSTGIAESPYHHSPDYAESSLRQRYLWIEFEQPLQASDDAYFGRVLAYGPDPLLAASLLPKSQPADMLPDSIEPPLPIDPEPVRQIFSGQSADQSGLDAMTQLIPAETVGVGKSGTFFLLPLPGTDSDDPLLFGFWTYEFRVGHANMWSTAQGRYGRPLRISGLQHPAPHLICSVQRAPAGVRATAPYAVTVYNGNRLYNLRLGDPQTRMWFMLYTQVQQADGASHRNVLLQHLEGRTVSAGEKNPQHGAALGPLARVTFREPDIETRLALLGLPRTSPLSVLAVEVLPGPLSFNQEFEGHREPQGEDPLGTGLGSRRILRTSPLTAVPATC